MCYNYRERLKKRIADFQTAIKLNSKYIKAYNSLALALGRQDKVEAADERI
ncbi:MAG UNVERIFIED_CONTAM: hypothetical protein LVR29_10170 [Microcystis novacekii LVE1205-3]|jgi:hypothetical protein